MTTSGCTTIWLSPAAAIAANHSTVMGPKSLPTLPVPKRCAAKRQHRMTAATGTTTWASPGAATCRPSTADSTLMAGVISESP